MSGAAGGAPASRDSSLMATLTRGARIGAKGMWRGIGRESPSTEASAESGNAASRRKILHAAAVHQSSSGISGRASPRTDCTVSGVKPSQSRRRAKASVEFSAAFSRQRDSLLAIRSSFPAESRGRKAGAPAQPAGAACRSNTSRSTVRRFGGPELGNTYQSIRQKYTGWDDV